MKIFSKSWKIFMIWRETPEYSTHAVFVKFIHTVPSVSTSFFYDLIICYCMDNAMYDLTVDHLLDILAVLIFVYHE